MGDISNKVLFYDLQAQLNQKWKIILKAQDINSKDIESAITLLPASIIVCEALFKEHQEEVNLLRSVKEIDYNTILKRLCNLDLFDICALIAKKWEMPEQIAHIIHCASGVKKNSDEQIQNLGNWMHLLLFYEFSQGAYIEAGLNDFLEFHIESVENIYPDFMEVMEGA